MTPQEVRNRLESMWPRNATNWGQATDEIRDMCRWARETLKLSDEFALNFRALKTPAEWNSKGIDKIIEFYEVMSDEERRGWRAQVNDSFSCRDGSTIFGEV